MLDQLARHANIHITQHCTTSMQQPTGTFICMSGPFLHPEQLDSDTKEHLPLSPSTPPFSARLRSSARTSARSTHDDVPITPAMFSLVLLVLLHQDRRLRLRQGSKGARQWHG